MIKLLIGGSPCTYWSIAQKQGREVTASGLGWELFKNYLIAKEKFLPDYFLYENNKSAAQAIKDQIAHELGTELMYINSALVSAQNRQRFYVFNWGVEQPLDRGILLKDIIEDIPPDICNKLAADTIKETPYRTGEIAMLGCVENHAKNGGKGSKQYRVYSTEGKAPALCGNGGGIGAKTGLYAVPVKLADIGNGGQGNRLYSVEGKAVTQTATSGGLGSNTGLYAIPLNITADGKAQCLRATCYKDGIRNLVANNVDRRTCVAIPINTTVDGKAHTLKASYGKSGTTNFVDANHYPASAVAIPSEYMKNQPVYEVKDGFIYIKGNTYPIELQNGFYIIRKLTVTECCRLQTIPDNYCNSVSKTQAYKGLGNGWTAEVIIHILNGILRNVDRNEKIVVLSMYDGIGTGRYCLEKMGFTNIEYHAYEIDEAAMKIANSNYPDIIQHGDAFALRNDNWTLKGGIADVQTD